MEPLYAWKYGRLYVNASISKGHSVVTGITSIQISITIRDRAVFLASRAIVSRCLVGGWDLADLCNQGFRSPPSIMLILKIRPRAQERTGNHGVSDMCVTQAASSIFGICHESDSIGHYRAYSFFPKVISKGSVQESSSSQHSHSNHD